jgi:hypothetical protein
VLTCDHSSVLLGARHTRPGRAAGSQRMQDIMQALAMAMGPGPTAS